MVAIDVLVPQSGALLVRDEFEAQLPELADRSTERLLGLAAQGTTAMALTVAVLPAWRRQKEQSVVLHPQHRDAAAHLLEPAVGLAPTEAFANELRERPAGPFRVLRNEPEDFGELGVGELPAAVLHRAPRPAVTRYLAVVRCPVAARRSA